MRRIYGVMNLLFVAFVIWHECNSQFSEYSWITRLNNWADGNWLVLSFVWLLISFGGFIFFIYFLKGFSLLFISGGYSDDKYKELGWEDVYLKAIAWAICKFHR